MYAEEEVTSTFRGIHLGVRVHLRLRCMSVDVCIWLSDGEYFVYDDVGLCYERTRV